MDEELQNEIKGMMYPEEGSGDGEELQERDLSDGQDDEGEGADDGGEEEGQGEAGNDAEAEGEQEETLEQRYARLLEEHSRVNAALLEAQNQGYAATPQAPPNLPGVSTPLAPVDFKLDDELISRALIESDPAAMKEVLTGIIGLVQRQQEVIRENVLLALPQTAQSVARQEFAMLQAVSKFYEKNEDLIPYQPICGAITNEIVAKEPNLSLPEVLQKVEVETRRRLGLKKQALETSQTTQRGKPTFAKAGGSRRSQAPKVEGLRGEIAQMQAAR